MLSKTFNNQRNIQKFYFKAGQRSFAAATQELTDSLKKLGITNKNVVHNPT